MKLTNSELVTSTKTLCANARKYLTRRAEVETDLASRVAEANFSLEPKACAAYRDAFASVQLARELEPGLRAALRAAWQATASRDNQISSDVESRHAEIDNLIAADVARRLPADLAGAKINFKETPLFRAELSARYSPNVSGGGFPPPADTSIDHLVKMIEEILPRIEKVDRELQRCAAVRAKFQPKAA